MTYFEYRDRKEMPLIASDQSMWNSPAAEMSCIYLDYSSIDAAAAAGFLHYCTWNFHFLHNCCIHSLYTDLVNVHPSDSCSCGYGYSDSSYYQTVPHSSSAIDSGGG